MGSGPPGCTCTSNPRPFQTLPPCRPQAVEYEDEDSPGTVRQLNMSDTEFREFIGLLKGFEAEEVAVDAGKGKGKKKK